MKSRLQSLLQLLRPSPAVQRILSFALTLGILGYLLHALSDIGWQEVLSVLPRNPLFYALVAASYLMLPVIDFIIFRRFWALPLLALAPLSKKRVLNDAVLGHSGDAWFYLWAKQALDGQTPRIAPLSAVKDVAIMSALAGNIATLAMLALAFLLGGGPVVQDAFAGPAMQSVGLGFAFVISVSIGLLLFSRQVLGLSRRDNVITLLLHCLRLVLASALLILAWAMALPLVPLGTWIVLEALRLVVTRLPFVPNKELLFAAIGVSLTGSAAPAVAALMAAAGALFLLGHILAYAGAALCRCTTIPEADPLPDICG